jgi:flavin reductase (DIM6/NTAB) family NADH-FMN oxidoreductase RutF
LEVSEELFRSAWRKFPSGVAVVTTSDEDGGLHGMTAVSVLSISTEPPMVLVSVGRERRTFANLERLGRFGLNILSDDQTGWAEHFALPPQERGSGLPGEYRVAASGVGILEGSLAFMDCNVVAKHDAGDHVLFIGQVESAEGRDGSPLVHLEGEYLSLNQDAPA